MLRIICQNSASYIIVLACTKLIFSPTLRCENVHEILFQLVHWLNHAGMKEIKLITDLNT